MVTDRDLFDTQAGGLQSGVHKRVDGCSARIELAAHRLAVDFTVDETTLPARFNRKTSAAKSKKIKEDSEVEKRFRANVNSWKQLIEMMLGKINKDQAWRFIDRSPEINPTVRSLADCKDFCDFMDYLVLRRDKERCPDDELGGLAMLSVAFQSEIEKRI